MSRLGAVSLARLGLLCSVALALYALEAALPRPLPWMKLGLSNVAVLGALILYGPWGGLAVSAVKVLIGGLLSGSLGGPAFVLAAGAATSSLAAMALPARLAPRLFSPVGLSLLGATAHQLSQLVLAQLYVAHQALHSLLPLFLVTGLFSGVFTGVTALWILRRLAALGQL
ncbi:MAG: Gx transporter family protein [Gemmatimonadota bacterium]